MHPRNKYRQQPDFKYMALEYPDFRKYVTQDIGGRVKVNFRDPLALRSLTKCLLKMDFGLEIEIPENHLVPTVPQRLNYLLWVEDLLQILPLETSEGNHLIIDIGTGPCCIFPLLGSKLQNWNFLATESNDDGFHYALRNVESNCLTDRINVVKVANGSSLLDLLEKNNSEFSATMCNPPFFSDAKDANWEAKARSKKRPPPNSCNPAHNEEIIFSGGEVAFVKKMIEDSFALKDKIKIYTTMLGKKCSLKEIKTYMKQRKIPQFTTTEFVQGKTMRWGIAWSFIPNISFNKMLKNNPTTSSKKNNIPISFFIPSNKNDTWSLDSLTNRLTQLFDGLKLQYNLTEENYSGKVWNMKATENTWSHQRRKRREEKRVQQQVELTLIDQPSTSSPIVNQNTTNGVSIVSSGGLKRKNDDVKGQSSKKAKIDDPCYSDDYILNCDLTLKLVGKNFVLEFLARPNMRNKEALYQVMQYFKNKFS